MTNPAFQGPLWQLGNVEKLISEALDKTGDYGLSLTRSRTPIQTGNLNSKWEAQANHDTLTFRNDAFYSGWVEFGTTRQRPKLMLTGALPSIQAELGQQLEEGVRRHLQ